MEPIGSENEKDEPSLQMQQSKLSDLLASRDEGLRRVQNAADASILVLPHTASSGRDIIRRDIDDLQRACDEIMSGMSEAKVNIDNLLLQDTERNEAETKLTKWLQSTQAGLKQESSVKPSMLNEKKTLLERAKALNAAVVSKQTLVSDIRRSGFHAEDYSAKVSMQLLNKYDILEKDVKEFLSFCESSVTNHESFNSASQEANDWLRKSNDQLAISGSAGRDRQSIVSNREQLAGLQESFEEGQKKLKLVMDKLKVVLPCTDSRGQDLLNKELKLLTDGFEELKTSVSDAAADLDQFGDLILTYDKQFDDLSTWLNSMEVKVKNTVELLPTLDEKQCQKDLYASYSQEISEKQRSFDDIFNNAQSLRQNNTDPQFTVQLTQLNTRYSQLSAFIKDVMIKLEQNIDHHKRYKTEYKKCITWLDEANKKLDICNKIEGDMQSIKNNLEQLQMLSLSAEQSQSHLISTDLWAKKTYENTSPAGCNVIQTEMNALQQSWDEYLTSLSEAKARNESCLLKWADLDKKLEQVQGWLNDKEGQVWESELRPDLAAKKALLQKTKSFLNDVKSQEPIIETLASRGSQNTTGVALVLINRPESEEVSQRYKVLFEKVKKSLKEHEYAVSEHQSYQDACNTANAWLRTTRERLVACSEVHGDKKSMLHMMEKLQTLENNLSEGEDLVKLAQTASETVLLTTEPLGCKKIKQEVQTLTDLLSNLHSQIGISKLNITKCLALWFEYEKALKDFSTWIQEASSNMVSEHMLCSSLPEHEECLEKHLVYHQDVISHKTQMDNLNQKAQHLLDNNSDAQVSHAIMQLSTKHQALIARSTDRKKALESSCRNHRNYNVAIQEFHSWLQVNNAAMSTLAGKQSDKTSLEKTLHQLDVFVVSMDQGQLKLKLALDSSEPVYSHTTAVGCKIIQEQCSTGQKDLDTLASRLTSTKSQVEKQIEKLSALSHARDAISRRLNDIELKLKSESMTPKRDLAEKKIHLGKLKILAKDLESHKLQINDIVNDSSTSGDPSVEKSVLELFNRYSVLSQALETEISDAQLVIGNHEQYADNYRKCLDWTTASKHNLRQLKNSQGSPQEKLSELEQLQQDLLKEKSSMEQLQQLSQQTIKHTSPPGSDQIKRDVESLVADFVEHQGDVSKTESSLNESIESLGNFQSNLEHFEEWLHVAEETLVKLSDLKLGLTASDDLRKQFDTLKDDVLNHQEVIDDLKKESSYPLLSEAVISLAARYQSLLTSVTLGRQKVEEFIKVHELYTDATTACLDWLTNAQQKLERVQAIDMQLPDKLNSVKELVLQKDEGDKLQLCASDAKNKLFQLMEKEARSQVGTEFQNLTTKYETFNKDLDKLFRDLKSQTSRLKNYQLLLEECQVQLLTMEKNIQEAQPTEELAETKMQLDKLHDMQIDADQMPIKELHDLMVDMIENEPDSVDQFIQRLIESRYNELILNLKIKIEEFESLYEKQQNFRDILQSANKWILQTLNSVSTSTSGVVTFESVQSLLANHDVLVKDIENYQQTISSVEHLGRDLIGAYKNISAFVPRMEGQLKNVRESYVSVKNRALETHEGIAEALIRWQNYGQVLDECSQFITSVAEPFLCETEKNPDVPDVSVQSQPLTAVKVSFYFSAKK